MYVSTYVYIIYMYMHVAESVYFTALSPNTLGGTDTTVSTPTECSTPSGTSDSIYSSI